VVSPAPRRPSGRFLDYPWGLLAFVAIAALYGLR